MGVGVPMMPPMGGQPGPGIPGQVPGGEGVPGAMDGLAALAQSLSLSPTSGFLGLLVDIKGKVATLTTAMVTRNPDLAKDLANVNASLARIQDKLEKMGSVGPGPGPPPMFGAVPGMGGPMGGIPPVGPGAPGAVTPMGGY